jgi:hypothetical protein
MNPRKFKVSHNTSLAMLFFTFTSSVLLAGGVLQEHLSGTDIQKEGRESIKSFSVLDLGNQKSK